jgi:hypothetical protein
MLIILKAEQYDGWQYYAVEDVTEFFTPGPANQLVAAAAPRSV